MLDVGNWKDWKMLNDEKTVPYGRYSNQSRKRAMMRVRAMVESTSNEHIFPEKIYSLMSMKAVVMFPCLMVENISYEP